MRPTYLDELRERGHVEFERDRERLASAMADAGRDSASVASSPREMSRCIEVLAK